MSITPRPIRPVPDPLAGYLRVGRGDHGFLTDMLTGGRPVGSGLVASPVLDVGQIDLFEEARRVGIETVLDPLALELSTVGGLSMSGVSDLAWSAGAPHNPSMLNSITIRQITSAIADHVATQKHTAVLAPSHILSSAADPWLSIDEQLTASLRAELDARGLKDVPIYYRLATTSATFNDPDQRSRVAARITKLPIDSVWLRVHPFGTTAGPLALRRYLEACRDLHQFGVPLVGEHTGAVGVALMAFGALGAVESGVTKFERTDFGPLTSPKEKDGKFNSEARVYLHQLGVLLARTKAIELLNRPGMKSVHGCQNSDCCKRGWRDTIGKYREHFVHARALEVAGLSTVPDSLRPGIYMEDFLRPASDRAVRAAEYEPALASARKVLDQRRSVLGAELENHPQFTVSRTPTGRRLRRSA